MHLALPPPCYSASAQAGAPASGFTLVEALVVVALLAILASLAGPELSSVIRRARVNGAREEFVASIQLARTESMVRRTSVLIVPNSACADGIKGWACGWIVAVDGNNDDKFAAPPDTVLQRAGGQSDLSIEMLTWGDKAPESELLIFRRWGQISPAQSKFLIYSTAEGKNDKIGTSLSTVCLGMSGVQAVVKGGKECP